MIIIAISVLAVALLLTQWDEDSLQGLNREYDEPLGYPSIPDFTFHIADLNIQVPKTSFTLSFLKHQFDSRQKLISQLSWLSMASPSFFDKLSKSFEDVPIDTANDNAVATTDFLAATESLCTLFGSPPSPQIASSSP